MERFKTFLSVMLLSAGPVVFAASEAPQSFTLDGKLFTSDGVTPLRDATAKVRVQVLNPAKNCVLYDEEQTVDTMSSGGHFNIQVGSAVGASKRKPLDSGNTMALVYQNTSSIPGSSCTYSPVAGDVRYIRVVVTPTSSSAETLSPDMVLDAVPNAIVAQSLQGVEKSGFLQTNPAALLTQTRLEQLLQTLTGFPGMGVSYNGTNFVTFDPRDGGALNSGSVTDTQIGSVSWAKISAVPPAINAVATLSCTNGEILKFVSGAWACGIESGVGVESDPTVSLFAKTTPGVGLATNGLNQIVPDFGTGASKVVEGNDPRLTDSRAPNGSASGDLSGSYPNPLVAKLQGHAVSGAAPADGQVLRYDNGTSTWIPVNFGIGDLKTSLGGSQFISASCTSAQTLIWSAVTDDFQCTNISLPIAQVTGTLPVAQGGTGQTSVSAAINALLPSQGSNSGKFLTTDGTNVSWVASSMTESDPKVGSNTTNYLSKWNGTALVASAVVESSGNVGIGTAVPARAMDISAAKVMSGALGSQLRIQDTTAFGSSPAAGIAFATRTSSLAATIVMAGIQGAKENAVSSDTAGYLSFFTAMDISPQTEKMRITSMGNVGIGTSTPTTKLDVNGTINATAMTINGVPVGTATGVASLNGSSQATQTFANGTSGTTPAFNTVVGTGVHTLNIPMANTASVTAGLISKTEFDAFNSKVGTSYSLAGDVTGTPAATVVDRIKGVAVSAAPTSAGQVLRYSGSQFVPAYISMQDLRSQTTGATALVSSCASNQTLTYNSVGDNLTCSNISLPVGQLTGTFAIANGGTGQTTASAAFNALSPLNTLGDTLYGSASGVGTRLAGNTSATKMFLSQTGTGSVSAAPAWGTIAASDVANAVINGGNTGALTVGTNDATSLTLEANNAAALTILSNGNVGIGTISPGAKLHVSGNSGLLNLEGTDHAYIQWYPDGVASGRKAYTGFGASSDNNFTIANEISGAHINLMTTGAGRVGIGTVSPGQMLSVAGVIESTSGGVKFPDGTTQTTAATGGGTNVQVFNASGTWTKPSSGSVTFVRCWGGGGSGGRGNGSSVTAGGGGGGGYAEFMFETASLSSTITVTIGAGGASVSGSMVAGNVGGNTTFGSKLTAYGGGGGQIAGGGGGGGSLSAASAGTGGSPFGGGPGSPGENGEFGGAGGGYLTSGTAALGGSAIYGGGGGGGQYSGSATGGGGGSAIYGGAGGGGGAATPGSGGTSKYGGNGGAGHATAGVAGTQPGGGGGGARGGTSGEGGDGKCIAATW